MISPGFLFLVLSVHVLELFFDSIEEPAASPYGHVDDLCISDTTVKVTGKNLFHQMLSMLRHQAKKSVP